MKCSLILLISSIIGFAVGYLVSGVFWGIVGAIVFPFLIVFYGFCRFVGAMVYPAEEDDD